MGTVTPGAAGPEVLGWGMGARVGVSWIFGQADSMEVWTMLKMPCFNRPLTARKSISVDGTVTVTGLRSGPGSSARPDIVPALVSGLGVGNDHKLGKTGKCKKSRHATVTPNGIEGRAVRTQRHRALAA